jgi:hypothetical protein
MGKDFLGSTEMMLISLLAVVALVVLGTVAARLLPLLASRYDRQTLRVEPPEGTPLGGIQPLTSSQQAIWAQLIRWCMAGYGPGDASFWRPWQAPRIGRRLSLAMMPGAHADIAQLGLVEQFSRQLDGSVELARAGGRWAGWWLRLRVKRNDCLWWRARQVTDPWDCGYLVNEPDVRAALRRFRPRRATLMVLTGGWSIDALRSEIEALNQRSQSFQHPVRLLITSVEGGVIPAGEASADAVSGASWSGLPCEMSLIRALKD